MNDGNPSKISNKTTLPKSDLLAQVRNFDVTVRLSMLIALISYFHHYGHGFGVFVGFKM